MRHSVGACQLSYRHFLTTGAGWASTDHTQGRILWHLGCRDSDSKLRSVQFWIPGRPEKDAPH